MTYTKWVAPVVGIAFAFSVFTWELRDIYRQPHTTEASYSYVMPVSAQYGAMASSTSATLSATFAIDGYIITYK